MRSTYRPQQSTIDSIANADGVPATLPAGVRGNPLPVVLDLDEQA